MIWNMSRNSGGGTAGVISFSRTGSYMGSLPSVAAFPSNYSYRDLCVTIGADGAFFEAAAVNSTSRSRLLHVSYDSRHQVAVAHLAMRRDPKRKYNGICFVLFLANDSLRQLAWQIGSNGVHSQFTASSCCLSLAGMTRPHSHVVSARLPLLLLLMLLHATTTASFSSLCNSTPPPDLPVASPSLGAPLALPSIFTGHFSGGGDLRFAPDDRSYYTRAFTLSPRDGSARATTDPAVVHLSATLTLSGTRRHSGLPHSVSFGLDGYYSISNASSTSTAALCMAGSGSYAREDGFGVVVLSDVVLRLRLPHPANLSRPFVTGRLGGADFDSVALVAYAEDDYEYGETAASCPPPPAPVRALAVRQVLRRAGFSCGRLRALLRRSYSLKYRAPNGRAASGGDSFPLRLRHGSMYVNQLRCAADGAVRAYMVFYTNQSNASPFNYTARWRFQRQRERQHQRDFLIGDEALVAQGSWDLSRSQLCLRACRVATSDLSRADLDVRECGIVVRFWFPAEWSIRDRSVAAGTIWNTSTSNSGGDTAAGGVISVSSRTGGYMGNLSDIKYSYSRVEEAKKHYNSMPALSTERKGRFPSNYSYWDFTFKFFLKKQRGLRGYASPVTIGSALVEGGGLMAEEAFAEAVDVKQRLLNVSYDLQFQQAAYLNYSHVKNNSPQPRRTRISAEGVYDTKTGSLCMVTCQAVANGSSSDCEILVTVQFAPMDAVEENRAVGTIRSLRKKGDPLFFEALELVGYGMYAQRRGESSSRVDMESVMLVLSMTLSCVFTALQLRHVRKHPEALPATSATMLAVLALGYVIPLVLNLEDMYADSRKRFFVQLTTGGSLELNEFMLRASTMLAFVLQLRLLQLSLSRRGSTDNNQAATASKHEDPAASSSESDSERSTLWICLPLYALGAVVVWIVHMTDVDDAHGARAGALSALRRPALVDDLAAYAGLVLDGFLLPQVVRNAFSGARVPALSPWFYGGGTVIRAAPHVYDVFRRRNYVPSWRPSYVYANPRDDLFGVAWDVAIPCGAALLAVVLFLQQRLGGAFLCCLRSGRSGEYQKAPTKMAAAKNRSHLASYRNRFLLLSMAIVSSSVVSAMDSSLCTIPSHAPEDVPAGKDTLPLISSFQLSAGYFFGGEDIHFAKDESTESLFRVPRSLTLLPLRVHYTTDSTVIHVSATLTLSGGLDPHAMAAHRSRRRNSFLGSHTVIFHLDGYYSSASAELCMAGSGTYTMDDGWLKHLPDVVLRLRVPSPASLSDPFVTGRLKGTGFEAISLVAHAEGDGERYEYGQRVSCPPSSQPSSTTRGALDGASFSCARLREQLVASYKLQHGGGGGHASSTSPALPWLQELPRMHVGQVQCAADGAVRVYATFSDDTNMWGAGHRRPGFVVSEVAVVAEGRWDSALGMLCLTACRAARSAVSLAVRQQDCGIGMSFWFPAFWTVRDRSIVAGTLWNSSQGAAAGSNAGDDAPAIISASSIDVDNDNNRGDFSDVKYTYTMVEEAKERYFADVLRSQNNNKKKKVINGPFPAAAEYTYSDFEFRFYVENRPSELGEAHPVTIGSAMVYGDSRLAAGDGKADMEYGLLNISYYIHTRHLPPHFNPMRALNTTSPVTIEERLVTAEGVYDPRTGVLCMIGCQELEHGSTDCRTLITVHFASLDAKAQGHGKGVISSLRAGTDPLFFAKTDIVLFGMFAEQVAESVSRMDLESVMLVLSATLPCVFTALQIIHAKRNPEAAAATSIAMLLVLALGYAAQLVIGSEGMFVSRGTKYAAFQRTVPYEPRQAMLRVPTLLAFVLQLRLLQLCWSARRSPAADRTKAEASSAAERTSVLWVCLPLWVLGGALTLALHESNSRRAAWVDSLAVRVGPGPATVWEDLAASAGLALDGFLLPQVVMNAFSGSRVRALSPWFYVGGTVARAVPRAYDVVRSLGYVPSMKPSHVYASPLDDRFGVAWDIAVPCGAALLAVLLFLQQRLGGAFLFRSRGTGEYETVST
ncbi:hypothetical protein U9M48_018102 [Paspalum notatum var. saurae]|uniref:RING-type E3 ubiquitin transferase n=1 Tax=Paspalum notatum var. saurae TaxID=547442 RepID=A0AAQ3TC24_PASNO